MPMDEVLRKKINNDATAFLRSFSEKRGRNPKLAETAITDARAFTEQEALDGHLIDYVASSKEELLGELNGRESRDSTGKKKCCHCRTTGSSTFNFRRGNDSWRASASRTCFSCCCWSARSDSIQNSRTLVFLRLA